MIHDPQHKRPYPPAPGAGNSQLQEVEKLVGDLKALYPAGSGDQDIRSELALLEQRQEYYRQGSITIREFCECCMPLLSTLHSRIRISANEGGAALSAAQGGRDEALIKVIRHIENLRNNDFT